MKKIISIMLTVLMIFSCVFAVSASEFIGPESGTEYATECTCKNHDADDEECNCCLNCENLREGFKTSCAIWNEEKGCYEVCCGECRGVVPCNCGCDCCKDHDQSYEDKNDGTLDEIWGDEEKKDFVDGFQKILKQISDIFDKIFDAIFEFLRIDEVLGKTE